VRSRKPTDAHFLVPRFGFQTDNFADGLIGAMAMGDKTRGLYNKFTVTRTDGTSAPGGKHDGCEYFVLDLTHDKHAAAAIKAYANSCRAEYPLLAADLDAMRLLT
jgi:hypothetical protein